MKDHCVWGSNVGFITKSCFKQTENVENALDVMSKWEKENLRQTGPQDWLTMKRLTLFADSHQALSMTLAAPELL